MYFTGWRMAYDMKKGPTILMLWTQFPPPLKCVQIGYQQSEWTCVGQAAWSSHSKSMSSALWSELRNFLSYNFFSHRWDHAFWMLASNSLIKAPSVHHLCKHMQHVMQKGDGKFCSSCYWQHPSRAHTIHHPGIEATRVVHYCLCVTNLRWIFEKLQWLRSNLSQFWSARGGV